MGFNEDVYSLLKLIPKGKVTTYKAVAEALGSKGYRAVGSALNKNKDTEKIPCYKVVKSDGTLGGYSRMVSEKIKRLERDGVEVVSGRVKDFEKRLFTFKNTS